jgi:kumamolisin
MTNLPPQGFARLAGSTRHLPDNAKAVGPLNPQEQIEVSVYLRDPAAGQDVGTASEHAQRPGSRLNRSEYASTHRATSEDLTQVQDFAQHHQLTVSNVDPVGRKIVLTGSAANMMTAFAVDLQRYQYESGTFRGRTGHIHVPTELGQIVTGVFGLDDRPQAKPLFRFRHVEKNSFTHQSAEQFRFPRIQTSSYTTPQVAELYDFPTSLDGTGECIGLIELGGGYKDTDLATYFQQLKLSAPAVVSIGVDGGSNSPSGDPSSADGEVVLDIEVAGSIAPKARIAVYFAPNTDRGFLDAITQAIHDTTNAPSILSISWGGPESSWTAQAMQAMDAAFQTAATLGITICCAAGDNGSGDGVNDQKAHVDFPASSPNVLGCGGTTLNSSNNVVSSEVVWNNTASNNGATGGGISDTFDLPTWQSSAHIPTSTNADKRVGRGVPDVAGDADPQTGYQIYVDGQSIPIGGTSAVAPLWAGLIALFNQKMGKSVGFLNPFLYQNYQSLQQAKALRDVTTGNNGSYTAGPGWDACTGLGTPDGTLLLDALAKTTTPAPAPSLSTAKKASYQPKQA